jgi:small subunit ribosomal protein S6
MASTSLTSTLTLTPTPHSSSNSPFCPNPLSQFSFPPLISFSHCLRPFLSKSKTFTFTYQNRANLGLPIKAQTLDFSGSFFEGGFGSNEDPPSPPGPGLTAVEDKEAPECPPGLRQYETMAVLRPDMSEDERLALTQKYEEVNFAINFDVFVALCFVAEKYLWVKNFLSVRMCV